MIFDTATLPLPLKLKADLAVVGSGPGGAMVAMLAAEAGLRVVLLEAGEFLAPSDMNQREEDMLPRLFWEGGGRSTSDRAIKVHQGKGVGGSSLHNLNLCKRIPDPLLAEWRRDHALESMTPAIWSALYDEVEQLLEVSTVERRRWNRHNRLLEAGCQKLGWQGGGLRHNRSGCVGSGFCELGCAFDAKNNACKVLVPRAVKAGAEIFTRCQAVRITHSAGRVTGLSAVALHPLTREPLGAVEIQADQVCLSASATGTAAILLRSRVPDRTESTGNSLRIHPAVVAAGEFENKVLAWQGIPQTYECTEFLDFNGHEKRIWILPAFAHPMGTATMMPGHGALHRQLMTRYDRMAVLTAMCHDTSAGQVRPDGELGLSIDYKLNSADQQQLALGLWASARLLFAAGAKRVIIPGNPVQLLERGASLAHLKQQAITPGAIDLTAVHPMGSVPMSDDPKRAALDSNGKHRELDGLWVADGSVFPTSIGVPPQVSIYAIGMHVGRKIVS